MTPNSLLLSVKHPPLPAEESPFSHVGQFIPVNSEVSPVIRHCAYRVLYVVHEWL